MENIEKHEKTGRIGENIEKHEKTGRVMIMGKHRKTRQNRENQRKT